MCCDCVWDGVVLLGATVGQRGTGRWMLCGGHPCAGCCVSCVSLSVVVRRRSCGCAEREEARETGHVRDTRIATRDDQTAPWREETSEVVSHDEDADGNEEDEDEDLTRSRDLSACA